MGHHMFTTLRLIVCFLAVGFLALAAAPGTGTGTALIPPDFEWVERIDLPPGDEDPALDSDEATCVASLHYGDVIVGGNAMIGLDGCQDEQIGFLAGYAKANGAELFRLVSNGDGIITPALFPECVGDSDILNDFAFRIHVSDVAFDLDFLGPDPFYLDAYVTGFADLAWTRDAVDYTSTVLWILKLKIENGDTSNVEVVNVRVFGELPGEGDVSIGCLSIGALVETVQVRGRAIDFKYDDFIVVAGEFLTGTSGELEFDHLGPFESTVGDRSDLFVLRLDLDLDPVEAVVSETPGMSIDDDFSHGVVIDMLGDVYLTGQFRSADISFGNSVGLVNPGGGGSFFLVKYNGDNDSLLAVDAITIEDPYAIEPGESAGMAITCDGLDVYVTGYFSNTAFSEIEFGGHALEGVSGRNVFVIAVEWDSGLVVRWAVAAADECSSTAEASGYGIDVDSSGNLIVTGSFTDSFAPYGEDPVTSNGEEDIFIWGLYALSGVHAWLVSAGGEAKDVGYAVTTILYTSGGSMTDIVAAIVGVVYRPDCGDVEFGALEITGTDITDSDGFVTLLKH